MYTIATLNLRAYLECAKEEYSAALESGIQSDIVTARKKMATIESQVARIDRQFVDGYIE